MMFGPNFISSVKNTLWSENIWAISLASILSTLPGVSSKTPNWRGQITQAKRTFQLTHSLDRVIVAPNVKACRHLVHLPAADVVRNNVARGSFLDIHAFVPVRGDNVPVHEVVVTVIRFVQIFELKSKIQRRHKGLWLRVNCESYYRFIVWSGDSLECDGKKNSPNHNIGCMYTYVYNLNRMNRLGPNYKRLHTKNAVVADPIYDLLYRRENTTTL